MMVVLLALASGILYTRWGWGTRGGWEIWEILPFGYIVLLECQNGTDPEVIDSVRLGGSVTWQCPITHIM